MQKRRKSGLKWRRRSAGSELMSYGNAAKYGYSNTRVKAMKAKLLDGAAIDNLMAAKDDISALAMLFQTDYKKSISDFGGMDIKSKQIDFALNRNFAERVGKVADMTPKKDKWIVKQLINKWYIYNVKTALEAKDRNYPYVSVEQNLLMLEPFTPKVILQAMGESSVDKMLEKLIVSAREYRNMLKEALSAYRRNSNILDAIFTMDKIYYTGLFALANKIERSNANISHMIRYDINMKDVMTLLRAKKIGLKFSEIKDYIVYRQKLEFFEKIFNDSNSVETLAMQIKAFDLKEAASIYKAGGEKELLPFEMEMRNSIFKNASRILTGSMLSLDVLAAYVYLKEVEMLNTRAILKGKHYGLGKDEISRLIVWKAG